MPSRKPKPCRSKKAAKSNFPQIRSLDPNQAGRDVVKDIMEGGRERWCFSPPRTYPSSIFSSPQIRNRDPDQRGRDIPEEIMAKGQGSKDSSPPGGHRSSRPTQQQYHHRQPYVRPTQQYYEHRSYKPRPGPEGRQPHYPERPVYSGANRMIRNRDPDQPGRDIPEEIMAKGQGSKDSSPPGGHRSSTPTQQQYRDRQPYVRRPQQYQDQRTYEPRPGPEGRHPHYPEQYPSSRGAERTIRNRDPDQRGRDDTEEIMAEGQESRYSTPPGGHRSSPSTPQQHSKRPGKQTPTAVDPTTQPILMNKKEASDTKPGPDDEPKLQPVGLRSSSPGLVPPDVQPKNSGNACKPVMKRVSLPVEPESDITPVISPHSPQDLFKEFCSILNRQTPQKFLQLVKQVKDSPIDTEEQLKGVVDLLFEKAMDETSSLVAYAKMCNCLATLTVPTPDKPQKTVNFRKLLISRCHEELEKLLKDKVDDRRSIGNIKFIGELFKVKMLNDFIVHDCLDKLLKNKDEVALECLCILLTVISKDLEYNETKMDHYFNSMEDIVTEGKTSPRIRYMLQDTIDLVSLNLVPRKAEQDPKPVQQIHNEATIEDQEEPRSVQQPLLSEGTKIQPDDAPTLQPVGLRSASPGLVLPEAPVAALQPQASSPAQVPTPPQNQDSEARGTLESSRTGSSKKRRRRRKHNNQLQTAGLRSASPGLVLPEAPGESGEAQATTPPREPELPLPASLSPPSIVEELLNFNNSKQLQCLHSDASSSEATLSEGSWSPWELQKQMLGIMLEDMACDSDIFECVKEKLERSQKSSSPYLMELMTAVCQAAVKENTSCPVHAALLQKGLPVVLEDRHSEKEQQMKALKDLQELIVTLDRPPNLLRMFFTCMCEEDISSEDSCIKSGTGKDQDEQLGKGVALQTVTAFFTWLREAEPQGN